MTLQEYLAGSPELRKLFVEDCKVNRIPVFQSATLAPTTTAQANAAITWQAIAPPSVPIREFDMYIQGKHLEVAELVCISEQTVKDLGLAFTKDRQLSMRDANGGTKATYGIIENLEVKITDISVLLQAWIIQDAPYHLLLGRPFQKIGRIDTEQAGEILVMHDPLNPNHSIRIPTRPHNVPPGIPAFQYSSLLIMAEYLQDEEHSVTLSVEEDSEAIPSIQLDRSPFGLHYIHETYQSGNPMLGLKYKPIAKKVQLVATTMPTEAIPKRHFPEDPLLTLPPLPTNPPPILEFGI